MKKNNKKISFIIVNYNSGNYLYHCVKSIDVNLEFDYEIIIIDNNSNDSSIKKINFKNSKIVTLKKIKDLQEQIILGQNCQADIFFIF